MVDGARTIEATDLSDASAPPGPAASSATPLADAGRARREAAIAVLGAAPAGWVDRVADARDWLRPGGPGRRMLVVAGIAVAVGIALWFLLRPSATPESLPFTKVRPSPSAEPARSGGSSGTPGSPSGSRTTVPAAGEGGGSGGRGGGVGAGGGAAGTRVATVWVDVTGAVARPGLVALGDGARVAEAITAAGGLAPDADRDRVNLAGRVVDGERVYIPRRGEQTAPSVVAGGAGGSGSGGSGGSPGAVPDGGTTGPPGVAAGPLDLNTATAEQLDTLPGIGPATAAAIVDYRTQHGPFRSVDELDQVRGLGAAKLAQLRPHLRVGP